MFYIFLWERDKIRDFQKVVKDKHNYPLGSFDHLSSEVQSVRGHILSPELDNIIKVRYVESRSMAAFLIVLWNMIGCLFVVGKLSTGGCSFDMFPEHDGTGSIKLMMLLLWVWRCKIIASFSSLLITSKFIMMKSLQEYYL